MRRRLILPLLLLAAASLAVAPSPAQAGRALLSEEVFPRGTETTPDAQQIEDACGLAIAPGLGFYVSDYYHDQVDLFNPEGTQLLSTSVGTRPEGPCSLATDSSGRLYVSLWHQAALRLLPGPPLVIDTGNVTGIAVDPATDYLYVDHHNADHHGSVSVFDSSGGPLEAGGQPLQIGLGSLGESFGIAAAAGRLYVADASSGTVKVFAADGDPPTSISEIEYPFRSLTDSALAIDPTNDHLLVVDNLQPGYEHPRSGIFEFDSAAAGYAPLAPLPGSPVHGEPSGIAVDSEGTVYVTDGNSELSGVFAFGSYQDDSSAFAPALPTPVAIAATLVQPSRSTSVPAARTKASRTAAKRYRRKRHHRRRVRRAGGRR